MSEVRLSAKARADIVALTKYGAEKFGARTAQSYLEGIYDLVAKLAVHPELGVATGSHHQSMRRYPFWRHVVFYEPEATGIYVLRVFPMARVRNRDELPD